MTQTLCHLDLQLFFVSDEPARVRRTTGLAEIAPRDASDAADAAVEAAAATLRDRGYPVARTMYGVKAVLGDH